MTFGIFFGLIGVPLGIILLAVACFFWLKDPSEASAAGEGRKAS